MKGSIVYRKDRRRWVVKWYADGTTHTISRYKGELLYGTHQDRDKCVGYRNARKLLALMQSDVENGVFRLEKYTSETPTDVIPYLWEWLGVVASTLSPATYKDYRNSIKNHLVPFFESNPVQLHEIQLDTLTKLLTSINRRGKGKMNVMYCLHACLDYSWRSNRIPALPPFPRKREYGVIEPHILWLPEERQMNIINTIPRGHQAIFWWVKYHLRRIGEARALFKEDYDSKTGVFIVRRAFSNNVLVDHTKTRKVHIVPCCEDFKPIIDEMIENQTDRQRFSPLFFANPRARSTDLRYTWSYMDELWKTACRKCGEDIPLYSGLKHSSCTQMIVEHGYNEHDVQMATDHARLESVKKYAKVEVSARKALLERRKVVRIDERVPNASRKVSN